MAKEKELEKICSDVVRGVDGAMGCAIVDLDSGLLLGVHHSVPYFTQTYLDAVAAAAVDLFRGRGISNVEELLSTQRGEEVTNTVREVQMTTPGTYHFMGIIPKKPNCMAVLITDTKANLGSGWSALRSAMAKMAPHCP
jgi:predicted regulator of Ras-like GTPase activity (Roadblock/LC7/MglB family)